MIHRLREIGLHARDVHSNHHGIVIMNKSPTEFATIASTSEFEKIATKFRMEKWIASYVATFGNSN